MLSSLQHSSVIAGLEPTQGKALEAHLNARPVWTQASLAHEMPDAAQGDLELLCQKLCYQFKEGAQQSLTLMFSMLCLEHAWHVRTSTRRRCNSKFGQHGCTVLFYS